MLDGLGGLSWSTIRFDGSGYNSDTDTNTVAAFLANGQLISTPIGGGALGSATSYLNPDGSTSTTPTAPPDAVNLQNYNAAQSNPVIDFCSYGYSWSTRNVAVKITKPGVYWLTFSATSGAGDPSHTGDGNGGGIDDVTLTALGSPYMTGPPGSPLVPIPVPSPQPDTAYSPASYPGFVIVADPFTPPAAAP